MFIRHKRHVPNVHLGGWLVEMMMSTLLLYMLEVTLYS